MSNTVGISIAVAILAHAAATVLVGFAGNGRYVLTTLPGDARSFDTRTGAVWTVAEEVPEGFEPFRWRWKIIE